MTILAAGARRRPSPPPPPLGPPGPLDIDSTDASLILDWSRASNIVTQGSVTGASSLREQDDIIFDPDGSSFLFYFSATIGGASYIWRTTSADGLTWAAPQACTVGGSPFAGQDPSLVQTFWYTPSLHRDNLGRMWLYCENNSTNNVDVYYSMDGLAWNLGAAAVIPKAGNGWEKFLAGSPVARHDGYRYIVGYEGMAAGAGGPESSGLAWGTSPTALTKSPNNPILTAEQLGAQGASAFWDSLYRSSDGARIYAVGHSGIGGTTTTMWRAYTTNTNPLTWTLGDFTLMNMVDPIRNDLTAWPSDRTRLVSAPANDTVFQSVPLALPGPA